MDVVGFYGWSSTDTVAVSFDTRWEILYDRMVKDWLAGNQNPRTLLSLGMRDTMTLADASSAPAVDSMNNKPGVVDAISPRASPLIPSSSMLRLSQRTHRLCNSAARCS